MEDNKFSYAAITYNRSMRAPGTAIWELTPDMVKKEILDIIKGEISDFEKVTIVTNNNDGSIRVYGWLSNQSGHLRDKSMQGGIIGRKAILRYSEEFKKFMNRFGRNDMRTYPDENNSGLVGVVLDVYRIMLVAFDNQGDGAAREFNVPRIKANIEIECHFAPGNEYKFGRFLRMDVIKKRAIRNTAEPVPKGSFNVRR